MLLNGAECFDTGAYDYVGTLTAADVQKNLDYITQYVYNSANRTVTTCRAPSRSADTTYDAFGSDKPTGSSGDAEIMSEDYDLADFFDIWNREDL